MFDILTIRDGLNALPFRDGQRRVAIGRISEAVEIETAEPEGIEDGDGEHPAHPVALLDTPAVHAYLAHLEQELARHDLQLARDAEDRDLLYAVQTLRPDRDVDLSWMGEAMSWAYRITAVGLEMSLPGILGIWLDARWGTRFLGWLGFLVGVPLGIWHLLLIAKGAEGRRAKGPPRV